MLTPEQRAAVRQTAREVVYEDAMQNWDYLKSIVDAFVDSKTTIEQAELVSSDPELWPEFWDFDPATGQEYAKAD